MRFESLSKDHNRADFDCGSTPLNLFLQTTARSHQKRGVSKTTILVGESDTTILGFFTLCASEINSTKLPPALSKTYPDRIGIIRLCRLAVDANYQGQGLGSILIHEAIRITVETSDLVGVTGMIVDAKDNSAAGFYKQYGFAEVLTNPLTLF